MLDLFDPILCSVAGHPAVDRWNDLINEIAPTFSVPPNLVKAHMLYESGGDPNIVSGDMGYGLMQITSGVDGNGLYNGANIIDPFTNIKVACRDFIAPLIHLFPGNLDAVIAGYNAGAGAVDRAIGAGLSPATTTYGAWYVPSVRGAYSFFNSASHAAAA